MNNVTVRELGGEIWAELVMSIEAEEEKLRHLDTDTLGAVIDLIMGVLARHTGEQIIIDGGLQVYPLPRRYPKD